MPQRATDEAADRDRQSDRIKRRDFGALIGDFERSLRVANKTERAVRIYGDAARGLAAFVESNGRPVAAENIRREHIEASAAYQVSRWKPATASQRYRVLAQLFKWLAEEGEIASNPFSRTKNAPGARVAGSGDCRGGLAQTPPGV